MIRASELRRTVITELVASGFEIRGGQLCPPDLTDKQGIRNFHAAQRRQTLLKNEKFIRSNESEVISYFASGADVAPDRIDPQVIPVEEQWQASLFRFASLHWSVPVSQGYGRRTRFLVMDRSNEKLLGIFALGDPVFNLKVRDDVIRWGQQQRKNRLYNVFDAYVLGAAQPYRQLIGGKLVALAAISNEVSRYLEHKYSGTTTHIQSVQKNARPVLITTTSSMGRSSTYNRIKFRSRKVYIPVGFTKGYGHFQFSDELFAQLREFVQQDEGFRGSAYGEGPNWKIRTIRAALSKLGLSGDLLKHGIEREVYLAPLGRGWRAFLRGETDRFHPHDFPMAELGEFFRGRWAVPRADRRPGYADWDSADMRLTPLLEEPELRSMTNF